MSDELVAATEDTGERLFALGVRHAGAAAADLVSAHKWFNLAARRGHQEALRRRLEIAAEMSPQQIAAAQRAARDWLAMH